MLDPKEEDQANEKRNCSYCINTNEYVWPRVNELNGHKMGITVTIPIIDKMLQKVPVSNYGASLLQWYL